MTPQPGPEAGEGRGGLAVALASAAAVLALLFIGAMLWGLWAYNGPGPEAERGEETVVILRKGAGLSEIANALDEADAIHSATVFKVAAQLSGAAGELKAGEYAFASGASATQVLGKIRRGEIVRHFVTIPEGVTSARAVDILMRHPVLVGVAPVPPEGTILPETYDVQRGDDRSAVLKRMMDARDVQLARLWAARQPGLPFDTPEEAVILASIVEKETGVKSERQRVAAVFVNRLRKGMRLETDPTVIYGVSRGEPLVDAQGRRRGIRRSELQTPTPYNTYLISGLPPTPIANPGLEALAATLNPADTEELFFVADGTGGHVFATNFEDHLRNVARWRVMERERAAAAAAAPALR